MSINKVKADEKSERLMMVLNDAVAQFTTHTPMAIGNASGRNVRRQLREMAEANIDYGTELTCQQVTSSLILPEHMQ